MKRLTAIAAALLLFCVGAARAQTSPGLVSPNQVVAGPSSGVNPGLPSGRTLVGADIPFLGTMATQNANNVDITGGIVTGLPTPTGSADAATKMYVDSVAAGLIIHSQALLATATALPTNTYNNGTSGVGATLTATTNGALTVDGVLTTSSIRIVVKNEATIANCGGGSVVGCSNGIYTVTTVGDGSHPYVLTRATDANTPGTSDPTKIGLGTFVFIISGTANGNTGWSVNSTVTTIGTSAINWVQFSGGSASGVTSLGGMTGILSCGSGISCTGSTVSATVGGSSGQIQYNNSGALGGFTMSGDVATNTSTGVATIQAAAVTNSKLATGAINTVKGTINGTSTTDLTPSTLFDSACSSTAGMAWIRTTVAWVCSQFLPLDPVWFGADPTGVADSAAAINAAIAALPAGGGEVHFAHCGTYSINSGTITVGNGSTGVGSTTSGVRLTSSMGCTTLKWTSASNGIVLEVFGPYQGFEISGFTIDCNSVANYGIILGSTAPWESHRGLNIFSCRQFGAYISTVTGSNAMRGVADNWEIVMPAVNGAVGMLLDGNCSGGGGTGVVNDAYQNTFNNLQIFPSSSVSGHAIIIKSADTNTFNSLLVFAGSTVNAGFNAVAFDYTGCSSLPGANLFNLPDLGSNIPGIQQWAVVGSPSGTPNFLTNINTINGGVTPAANAAWVIK